MAACYESERDAVRSEHRILQGSATLHGHDAQLDHRWEDALRHALGRGGLSDADATVAAGAILGVMRAVLRRWFESGTSFDLRLAGKDALTRLRPLLESLARQEKT